MSLGWGFVEAIGFWGSIASLIGAPLAVWALMPGWADYRQWLKDDRGYREKTVATLRGPGWDDRYRTWLEAGLAWLDRRFGEAGSARALGVCTVISLCYAWAAFFFGYAMGAPGTLGEIEFLPEAPTWRYRYIIAALSVALPVAAYIVGRWLGHLAERSERHLKALLLKRRRQKGGDLDKAGFERTFRRCSVFNVTAVYVTLLSIGYPYSLLGTALMFKNYSLSEIYSMMIFGLIFAAGPIFGSASARYTNISWLKAPIAAASFAAILIAAFATISSVVANEAFAFSLIVAFLAATIALSVTFVGAGATLAAVALSAAILAIPFRTLAVDGSMVACIAGPIGVICATRWGRQDQRGAYAGGIGLMLLLAMINPAIGRVSSSLSILVITFLLLLPLINGFWDWLSWQVSRWLGQDLLKKLDGGGQTWTITWHALVDAAVAVLLLATLAFALAFGVETYNQFAEAHAGEEVYDLTPFVHDAAYKPWNKGFWLTAMLISTLVPTFLHFALLLASPLVMLVFASPKRAELAVALEGYETAEHKDAIVNQVGWYLARTQYVAWTGAILLTILLLALFAGFVGLILHRGPADFVADIAVFAIEAAHWVFGGSLDQEV